jgi:hypothetical protein
MQIALIIAIGLHALSGVFWAGTTFALVRSQGQGAQQLRKPQIGAAVLAILTGMALWGLAHRGAFGNAERVLGAGVVAALIAAAVQFASTRAAAQRIAAGLLAITVLCMVIARYAG